MISYQIFTTVCIFSHYFVIYCNDTEEDYTRGLAGHCYKGSTCKQRDVCARADDPPHQL